MIIVSIIASIIHNNYFSDARLSLTSDQWKDKTQSWWGLSISFFLLSASSRSLLKSDIIKTFSNGFILVIGFPWATFSTVSVASVFHFDCRLHTYFKDTRTTAFKFSFSRKSLSWFFFLFSKKFRVFSIQGISLRRFFPHTELSEVFPSTSMSF